MTKSIEMAALKQSILYGVQVRHLEEADQLQDRNRIMKAWLMFYKNIQGKRLRAQMLGAYRLGYMRNLNHERRI